MDEGLIMGSMESGFSMTLLRLPTVGGKMGAPEGGGSRGLAGDAQTLKHRCPDDFVN